MASSGAQEHARRRTKDIVRRLREQLEFYFGDMNLSRSNFLHQKLKESEYVPIEVLITFNRLKAISTDSNLIQKAVESSSLLKLSEDGTGIGRVEAYSPPSDVNNRTVYVEGLSEATTIDSLKNDFGKCGPIDFVSLPYHKVSKDLKGFAFVTFSEGASAIRALQNFDNFTSGLEPQYPTKESLIAELDKSNSKVSEDGGNKGRSGNEGRSGSEGGSGSEGDAVEPSTKKLRVETSDYTGDKKKKKRKRRKKQLHKYSYKVLHQLEWIRLKKIYVQLQKEGMSQAKQLFKVEQKKNPHLKQAFKLSHKSVDELFTAA